MRRREVLTLLTGAVSLARPLTARAKAKLPTIGFLVWGTRASYERWVAAFVHRLRELGWIETHTIAIEYRWAEGETDRLADIAAEFVQLKVDVIVTHSAEPVLAAKQATSVIPIVFCAAADPVRNGLVESLARPTGNVTGLSVQFTDLAAKRIELLREIVPSLRRLAIIGNVGAPGAVLEMREAQEAAKSIGLEIASSEIRQVEDITPALAALKGRAEALYVASDPLIFTNSHRINNLAMGARMPTTHGIREFALAGGLMSYGANFPYLFGRAADLVDKILKGARPADLPVEQPTKLELVINLKTARVLGLIIPQSILLRADEVIE